jgi:hypothetical protein
MDLNRPLMETIPAPAKVRTALGKALRQVELLQKLLRIAERVADYRQCDRTREAEEEGIDPWQ